MLFLGNSVFVALGSAEDIFKHLLVSSASSLDLSAWSLQFKWREQGVLLIVLLLERRNMSSGGDRFMAGKEMAEGENGTILFNELSLVLILTRNGQH